MAVLHVLWWMWVAGPSEVDVTYIFVKAVGVVRMFLTFTKHKRQPATLFWAPNIHSNVIL